MFQGFSLADLAPIGPPALVALFVVSIYAGRLVPSKERDYWRQAFFVQQEIARGLTDTSRATRDVLRALPQSPPDKEKPL